jgi:hypothetical protein
MQPIRVGHRQSKFCQRQLTTTINKTTDARHNDKRQQCLTDSRHTKNQQASIKTTYNDGRQSTYLHTRTNIHAHIRMYFDLNSPTSKKQPITDNVTRQISR